MKLKDFLVYLALFGLVGCDNLSETNVLDKALESGEPYFSILFNKQFARRFSLPEVRNQGVRLVDT